MKIFLEHCPSKCDRAFISMAMDTSCRPHKLLNLKIEDIRFKRSSDGLNNMPKLRLTVKQDKEPFR
ncbi:MAG TPA: hypothetical protein VIY08_03465 [Candidatus Nitrosocosmicus sp.]